MIYKNYIKIRDIVLEEATNSSQWFFGGPPNTKVEKQLKRLKRVIILMLKHLRNHLFFDSLTNLGAFGIRWYQSSHKKPYLIQSEL